MHTLRIGTTLIFFFADATDVNQSMSLYNLYYIRLYCQSFKVLDQDRDWNVGKHTTPSISTPFS